MMKINLFFHKWKGVRLGEVRGRERTALEAGNFHGGAVFEGVIYFDGDEAFEIEEALNQGFKPIFQLDIRR